MKQKFKRLSFVRVNGSWEGIIEGTYSQLEGGGRDVQSYAIYVLEDGKIDNNISWIDESEIELLENQDPDNAEELIEAYNFEDEDEYFDDGDEEQ